MKYLKTLFGVIIFCLISLNANAKVVFYSGGPEMQPSHVNGVRGLLYNSAITQPKKIRKATIQRHAAAIYWLNVRIKEKKVYNLKVLKSPESDLIRSAIMLIVDVLNRDHGRHAHFVTKWTRQGHSVVVKKMKDSKKKTVYKLYLKKRKKNGNNKK